MAFEYTQKDRRLFSGTRVCEICGKEGILEYMYAMGASWHVTGHFMIPNFSCQTEETAQHWGCCPEHAMAALVACLRHKEHMSVAVIKRKHKLADNMKLPRVAPEHEHLLDRYGDTFMFDAVSDMVKGVT